MKYVKVTVSIEIMGETTEFDVYKELPSNWETLTRSTKDWHLDQLENEVTDSVMSVDSKIIDDTE